MNDACASDGVGRNLVFSKTGTYIPRSQIRWIHGGNRKMKSDMFCRLPTLPNYIESPSSFDVMIDQMKEYGDISFTMLYNSTPETSISSTNNETTRHVTLHGQY